MDKNNTDHQSSKLLHESGIQSHCSQMLNALFSKDTDILDPLGKDDDYHWYIKSIYDINTELKNVAQSVLSHKIERLDDPQKADYLIRKEWAAYLYEYFRSRPKSFAIRHNKMYSALQKVLFGLSHLKSHRPIVSFSKDINTDVIERQLKDTQIQIDRINALKALSRQDDVSHPNQSIQIFQKLIRAGRSDHQAQLSTQDTRAFKDYLLKRHLSISEAHYTQARHVFDFLSLYTLEEVKSEQFFKFEAAINTFCDRDVDEAALRQFEGNVLSIAFDIMAYENEHQTSINDLHLKLSFVVQLTAAVQSFQDPVLHSEGGSMNLQEKLEAVLEGVKSRSSSEQPLSSQYTESLFKLSLSDLASKNNIAYTDEQICLQFLHAIHGQPFYELSVKDILKYSSVIFSVKSSGNPDFVLTQFLTRVPMNQSAKQVLDQLKGIYPKSRDQMMAYINIMKQPQSSIALTVAVLMTMPESDQALFWSTVSECLGKDVYSFEDVLNYNSKHDVSALFQSLERTKASNEALLEQFKGREVEGEASGVKLNTAVLALQRELHEKLVYAGIQSSGHVDGDSLIAWLTLSDQMSQADEWLSDVTPVKLTQGLIHQQLDTALKHFKVERGRLDIKLKAANQNLYKVHQLYDVLGLFFSIYDQVLYKQRDWSSLSIHAHHRKPIHVERVKHEERVLLEKVFEVTKTDHPKASYQTLVIALEGVNRLVLSYQTMGQQQLLDCLYTGVNKQNQRRFIKSVSEMSEDDFKFQSTKTSSKIAELIEYYIQMTQMPHDALSALLVESMSQAEMSQLLHKTGTHTLSVKDMVAFLETHPEMARLLAERYLISTKVMEIIFYLKDIEIARQSSDYAFVNYQLYKKDPQLFYHTLSYEVDSAEMFGFLVRNFAPNLRVYGADETRSLEGHIDTFIVNSLNGFKLPQFENVLSFLFVMCAFIAFWYSLSNPVGLFMGSIFIGCSIIFNTHQQTDHIGIVSYLSKSVFSANFDSRLSDLLQLVWDEKAQLDSFLKILNEVSKEDQPNMLRWFEDPGLAHQNLDQCLSNMNAKGSSLSARLRSLGDYQRIRLFNDLGLLKSKLFFKDVLVFYERLRCEDQAFVVINELDKRFPHVGRENITAAMLAHAPSCVAHDQRQGVAFDGHQHGTFKGMSLFNQDQMLNVCAHLRISQNIEKQLLSLEDANDIKVRPEFKYEGLDGLSPQDQALLYSQTTIGGIRSLVGLPGSCLGNNVHNRRFALQVLDDYRKRSEAQLVTNRVMPLGALTKGLFTQESALPWYYNDYNSSKGSSL